MYEFLVVHPFNFSMHKGVGGGHDNLKGGWMKNELTKEIGFQL
jgi:hypothetical protein